MERNQKILEDCVELLWQQSAEEALLLIAVSVLSTMIVVANRVNSNTWSKSAVNHPFKKFN